MIVPSGGTTGSEPRPEPVSAVRPKAVPARGARWLLLAIVSLGSIHVLFMIGVEVLRLARAEMSISRLEGQVSTLEREAEALQAIIEHRDDRSYREQLSRRQGYMYPDEVRVVTSEPR